MLIDFIWFKRVTIVEKSNLLTLKAKLFENLCFVRFSAPTLCECNNSAVNTSQMSAVM